jgi:SAM-dependent methyltransferase
LPHAGRSLDQALRASWVGRRLVWLRSRSPATYARLRRLYQRIVLRSRSKDLAPYQARALDEFFGEIPAPLLAVGVLEVGCDVDGRVMHELRARGVAQAVGINPVLTAADAERLRAGLPAGFDVQAVDMRASGLPSESFGAIFSVAVLEHLLDLDVCLAEMHRLLGPGGRVYAAFGPIWSSALGHHIFADVNGIQLRHWDPRLNPVEDYAHLLLSQAEMRQRISASRGIEVADAAVAWIYESEELNRMFFEDYVAAFERASLRLVRLAIDRDHVPKQRMAELRAAYPDRTEFSARNAVVVLEKPASTVDQRGGAELTEVWGR